MEKPRPDEIVSMVVAAATEVFGTMLNLPLASGAAHVEPVHPATYDGVVALLGVAGPWIGTGRMSCSPEFACIMAGALLTTTYGTVDEDVMDAVAEVSNMVMGSVKTLLEERVGPLALSFPTVIYGRSYKTRSVGVMEWTVVPFRSSDELLEVRFNLMEMPKAAYPAPRPQHFQV